MENSKRKQLNFLNLIPDKLQKRKLLFKFNEVLSSGNFILGEEVENFEKNFAKYLGVKYCIGMGNGLEAIQISLMSLEIGKGDEVITTSISAAATTLAILAVGAKPVFVDTTSDGLINPELIPEAITKRTKAILPVHLYGNPVDLNKIQKICHKHKLFLIEDAAQAHGSAYNGKKLGTFGDLGCFSFYPTKNLAALGDGGAIVTNSKKLAKICREIRDYGQNKKYLHVRFGLNSRLDELQAAILDLRLKRLDKENQSRKNIAERYIKNLSQIKQIEIIKSNNLSRPNYHLFVIKIKKRDYLKKFLQKFGIETLIHFPKIIPDQPFLKKEYDKTSLPVARDFVKTCLSLPCHPKMSFSNTNYVSSKIIAFFRNQPPNKI